MNARSPHVSDEQLVLHFYGEDAAGNGRPSTRTSTHVASAHTSGGRSSRHWEW